MTAHAGDVALRCMRVMAARLRGWGIAGVCISPGSRSTPPALAFGDGPRAFVHLDERAAAFVALGMARATGLPAVAVCTSGTAAANYLPAVVEASQARVPLILMTADRPPEARGSGSNQTIDQRALYGSYVRLFVDCDVPEEGSEGAWEALAARAWSTSLSPTPGPVHLNLPFREPLAPSGPVAAPSLEPVDAPALEPPSSSLERDLPFLLGAARAERGVVVAGGIEPARGDPVERVAELAAALGWPLIAEPASGLRVPGSSLSAGQSLLGAPAFADAHVPDVVLQFGTTPTTRASLAFVARARRLIVVDRDGRRRDPAGRAERTVASSPGALADAILARAGARGPSPWTEEWRGADAVARAALDAFLDAAGEPFEPRIARDVARALPQRAALFVGNSTPVRDLDLVMEPRAGSGVVANRGASGIDGTVSTALGVATTGPTVALVGDLAFFHDAGALIWGGRPEVEATFVVVNNNGGGIFDLLPGAPLPGHESLFATPHDRSIERVATAAGAGYATVSDPAALGGAIRGTGGILVVEVPVDRARALELRAGLRDAVRAALA